MQKTSFNASGFCEVVERLSFISDVVASVPLKSNKKFIAILKLILPLVLKCLVSICNNLDKYEEDEKNQNQTQKI